MTTVELRPNQWSVHVIRPNWHVVAGSVRQYPGPDGPLYRGKDLRGHDVAGCLGLERRQAETLMSLSSSISKAVVALLDSRTSPLRELLPAIAAFPGADDLLAQVDEFVDYPDELARERMDGVYVVRVQDLFDHARYLIKIALSGPRHPGPVSKFHASESSSSESAGGVPAPSSLSNGTAE